MDLATLQQNWALVAAAALLGVVAVVVARALWRQSVRGRLSVRAADYRRAGRERRQAAARADDMNRKLGKLNDRREHVAPRTLAELEGRLADAEALEKIAADREMVAANRLRQVIVEEFPPADHDRLRGRYFGDPSGNAPPSAL